MPILSPSRPEPSTSPPTRSQSPGPGPKVCDRSATVCRGAAPVRVSLGSVRCSLALPWYLPGGLSLGGSAAGPPTPPSRSFPDAPPPEVHSSSIFPRAGESGRDRRPTHRGSSRRPKIQDEDGGDGCLSRLVTARSAGKLAATMPNSGPCSGNQEPRRQPGSCDDQGPDEEYGARRRLTCMRAPPPDVERLELACIAAGAAPTPLWANPHPQHHYRYRRGR